ncbi:MAG: hypothetical protein LC802_08090 [Acidobacteria bacterium]|nr:hypothetical protein [Acidobacteriota bacterium]
MKLSSLLIVILIGSPLPYHAHPNQQLSAQRVELHDTTEWRVRPSFILDTVCFLNILTGDPFYVRFYENEYARFEPQLTAPVRASLSALKRTIKDENKNIISAFLALHFSATDDRTLDDMLRTLKDSKRMKESLKKTDYYNESGWQLYQSVREDLKIVISFLRDIRFEDYWHRHILPEVQRKIAAVEKEVQRYNVVGEVEKHLGSPLSSQVVTVYLLYYSQPHGIRLTGTRFVADAAYPFRIVLQNAIHEMLHPPYKLARDRELRKALDSLRADAFLMDKIKNHNPSFGYNSFESFVEENCVRALDQLISERFKIEREARQRWREEDDGMHVFAVALYSLMKREDFGGGQETFRDFFGADDSFRQVGSGQGRKNL